MVAVAVGRVEQRGSLALKGWVSFVLAFAALNYTARFAGPEPPDDVAYQWDSSIGAVIQYAVILLIVLLIARGKDKRAFFALRPPTSWATAWRITTGVIVVMIALSAALSPFLDPGEEQGLTPTFWDTARIAQFAAFAVAVVVVGPIVEELTFRGAGYSLLEPFGRWTAILVVGLAFGLVHGLLEGLLIITVFGLGLAYLRSRTESLYPCVLLHSGFNAAALVLSLTT